MPRSIYINPHVEEKGEHLYRSVLFMKITVAWAEDQIGPAVRITKDYYAKPMTPRNNISNECRLIELILYLVH